MGVAGCSITSGSDSDEQSSPTARATVEEHRNPTAIPFEPDGPSVEILPSTVDGTVISVDGAEITVPQGWEVSEGTNSAGLPNIKAGNSAGEYGLPGFSVTRVEDFGQSLADETYTQELLLSGEGDSNTYVSRNKVDWPDSETAYVIFWTAEVELTSGELFSQDMLGFWVSDGAGGGWIIIAAAEEGGLASGSEIWDAVFSFKIAE